MFLHSLPPNARFRRCDAAREVEQHSREMRIARKDAGQQLPLAAADTREKGAKSLSVGDGFVGPLAEGHRGVVRVFGEPIETRFSKTSSNAGSVAHGTSELGECEKRLAIYHSYKVTWARTLILPQCARPGRRRNQVRGETIAGRDWS